MKHTKKLLSVLLALAMVFALALPAFAAGTCSITVKNTSTGVTMVGNTYSAYKIFDATTLSGTGSTSYGYTPDADFVDFLTANSYTADSISGWVNDSAELNTFAADVKKYLDSNSAIAPDGTAQATEADHCTITGLEPGYYIVLATASALSDTSDSVVALCALNTTVGTNAEVNLKADAPHLHKQILEDRAGSDWGTIGDYDIGQNVPFRLISQVPDTNGYASYTYTVHDTMSKGLTFNNDVVVTLGGNTLDSSNYNVTYSTPDDTKITAISIAFNSSLLANRSYSAGTAIEIRYSATLNSDSVYYTDYEKNTAYLTYSSNPYDENDMENTPEEKVQATTYALNIQKTDGSTFKALSGATFNLNGTDGTSINFVKTGEGVYRRAANGDAATDIVTELAVSGEETTLGHLTLQGLDEGSYTLHEAKAPDGYNTLTTDKNITLTSTLNNATATVDSMSISGVVTEKDDNYSTYAGAVVVENNVGTLLPSTGGMGTTIFTIGGIVLMIGAGVVLVARRKVHNDNK